MCCKLYMCLDKLSPEERELVNRIYFLGYSLRQLSTTLDIYTHAFDKNKKAASDKLHNALEI